MVFRRGSQAIRLRPVNSLKHIVETNGSVSAAGQSVTDVIQTVSAPTTGTTNECHVGSSVHAIYLRVEVIGVVAAGGVDNIYLGVFKNPSNDLAIPNLDSVGASDRRRFMIHQEMLMTTPQATSGAGGDNGFPRTMFKGVISIPRGFKRNGVSDKLQVVLQHRSGEATQTTRFCIECIYKEFY